MLNFIEAKFGMNAKFTLIAAMIWVQACWEYVNFGNFWDSEKIFYSL